jgi:hypothetical protein
VTLVSNPRIAVFVLRTKRKEEKKREKKKKKKKIYFSFELGFLLKKIEILLRYSHKICKYARPTTNLKLAAMIHAPDGY